MKAMTTLPLHVRSTLKVLATTLASTANNETKFAWKVLIFARWNNTFLPYKQMNLWQNRTIRHNSIDKQAEQRVVVLHCG